MPRRVQVGSGGLTFHVMNRGVRRMCLFDAQSDYELFIRCALKALETVPMQIFAFCIMPNHFHMVVRPTDDPHLSNFMRLMTMRHSKRWHKSRGSIGGGAVYQGRFRAFPIETEPYFFAACRYVEANPLRAKLVQRAEHWPWSSLHQRVKNCNILPLTGWPILQPTDWVERVNASQDALEIRQLRQSTRYELPLGSDSWTASAAAILGRETRLRRPGPKPKVGS